MIARTNNGTRDLLPVPAYALALVRRNQHHAAAPTNLAITAGVARSGAATAVALSV
jgi:hypothetical protein